MIDYKKLFAEACDLLSDEWRGNCKICPYGTGEIFNEYCTEEGGCICDDVESIKRSIERLVGGSGPAGD